MKSIPKWFLIPPAVAVLLILGTLTMQGADPGTGNGTGNRTGNERPAANQPATGADETTRPVRTPPTPPRTPDLWQMSSGLIGVLLLGATGLMLLKRLRRGATPVRGLPVMTLRQSLRLGNQRVLHAIEFDERIVLVGESDKGLVLIEHGRLPERLADEAEVLARSAPGQRVDTTDEDEGAVPKNLVIPRPENPAARRLPKPPTEPQGRPTPGLGDFRNLLQKAGRA